MKRLKLAYAIYNFFQKRFLVYNTVLYKKWGLKKKYFSSVSSKDFEGLKDEINWLDANDSSEKLLNNKFFLTLNDKYKEALLSWSNNGYAILENFLSLNQVDDINSIIENLVDSKQAKWQNGNKIMFAIHQSEYLKKIGTDKKLFGILEMLLGKEIELFQSINFLTASKQRTHSDFIHMTTFPTGNIIAIWIALEDMTLDNGLLHYYPGSHKLPLILNKDFGNEGNKFFIGGKEYSDYEDKIEEVIRDNNLKKEVFLAKKGDVLIWHANLLHGGEHLINEELTRKSMVFHYYAKDVICYHELKQRPTFKKA